MSGDVPACEVAPIMLQQYGPDGWFFASVPSIPGLISFGPTMEETLAGLVAGYRLLLGYGKEGVGNA